MQVNWGVIHVIDLSFFYLSFIPFHSIQVIVVKVEVMTNMNENNAILILLELKIEVIQLFFCRSILC